MVKKEVEAQIPIMNKELFNMSLMAIDENINDISSELYNLHIPLKSLIGENIRIKNSNPELYERNNFLEIHLLEYDNAKINYQAANDELLRILKKEEILKRKLNLEKEVIAKWKESREVASVFTYLESIETFCEDT
ncbi:hypothetical protein AgCh_005553 [Apium graveolens]